MWVERPSRRGFVWSALIVAGLARGLLTIGCGPAPKPAALLGWNLLVVTLDTVRADHLGAYGYALATTPTLDALARRGLHFDQATAAAPLTLPSHATLLSGELPRRHGLRGNGLGRFPATSPNLAERLQQAGYRTGAFVSSFVLDHRFGLDRGFERYDDEVERSDDSRTALEAERPAAATTDRALEWLKSTDSRPFFAWVHYYDAHAPYTPPEPAASQHAGRPYDGEIAEVDRQLGRLIALLDERGWTNRTVIAVAGDHGEALGEHGELTHGFFLYESTLRVPFLLVAPGALRAGATVSQPVGLVDLAPTVAGLLGQPLAATAGSLDGRDLSPALREEREPPPADLIAETRYPLTFGWSPLASLRRGSLKYIRSPKAELYDLAQDATETVNRLAADRALVAELSAALGEAESDTETKPQAVDAETRARLAALGYVAPAGAAGVDSTARDPKDFVRLFREFEEAHWALGEGRLPEAIRRLETLLAADPPNPTFRATLASALRKSGDRRRALELYRQSVAAAPDDPENWHNLAIALQDAGETREAFEVLQEALRRDPDRPEALNVLAIGLAAAGRFDEARAHLERATSLDPRNARVWNNLGNVWRGLGKLEEAERGYRRAIELAPSYADPWTGLGTLEVERDRPRQALVFFERALELNPELAEVRLNRAVALAVAGERRAAVEALREFLAGSSSRPELAPQRRAAQDLLARLNASG